MAFCLIRHALFSFFSPRKEQKIDMRTLCQNNAFYILSKFAALHGIVSRLSCICNAALVQWQEKHSLSGLLAYCRQNDEGLLYLSSLANNIDKGHYDEHIIVRYPINVLFLSLWLLSLDAQTHPFFWSFCYSSWIVSDSFRMQSLQRPLPWLFFPHPGKNTRPASLESSSSKHSDLSTTAILNSALSIPPFKRLIWREYQTYPKAWPKSTTRDICT